MGSPRTGSVSVLFAAADEPVGFAVQAQQALLRRAEEIVAGASAPGGILEWRSQDAGTVTAVLDDATAAIRCAVALWSAMVDDGAIAIRIGLSSTVGESDTGGGPALHRAAALCAAAHPGQVLLSESTLQTATSGLPPEVAIRDLGVHRLADLGLPERVHQLLMPGADGDEFPPPRSLSTRPNNLPSSHSTLIGRQGELAETATLLARSRLLTLTGPGGCGKTRLALRLAGQTLPSFPDGAWWVDLSAVRSPQLVPASVATVLSVRERADEPLVDSIAATLRQCRTLLILDNCEHLDDGCAEMLDSLLAACPSLAVLATSRAVLGVDGEQVYRVPPLPVPEPGVTTPQIAAADAVRLFADRARWAEPGLMIAGDDLSAVAEICRRLDGIPLAIELAAARVSLMTPAEIASGLSESFSVLSQAARHPTLRHRSLEASLSWSYGLLDPVERRFLARLSVFSGGWTLQAARDVCGDGDINTGATLEQLSGLVDKSLVQVERSAGTRYRLLESIQAYARERLVEAGGADEVRRRHLYHYVQFAESNMPASSSSTVTSWLERLHGEVGNLRAAMDWALANQEVEQGLRIAAATWTYWLVRGHYGEMRDRMEASLAATADVDPGVRCRALIAAIMVWFTGSFSKTRTLALEAVQLARQAGSEVDLHRALLWCGWTEFHLGQGSGRPLLDEALTLARTAGDPTDVARAAMYHGTVAALSGDVAEGRLLLDEALTLARQAGHLPLLSSALTFRANAEITAGQLGRAEESVIEGLTIARGLQYGMFTAMSLTNLAWVRIMTGREEEAMDAADEAIEVARESGARVAESNAAAQRGMAAYALGDLDVAEQWFRTTLTLEFESGLALALCFAEWGLGAIARRRGDIEEAKVRLDTAAQAATYMPWFRGRVLLEQARLAVDEGDPARAGELAHDGADVLVALGDQPGACEAVEVLAGLAAGRRAAELAARLAGAAAAVRERIGASCFPIFNQDLRAALAPARKTLGETRFSATMAEGAALSLTEAVAYDLRGRGERNRPATGWPALTAAELQVANLVAEGLTNPQIAARLFITRNTVKTHLRSIFAKLDISTRSELASAAARRQPQARPGSP